MPLILPGVRQILLFSVEFYRVEISLTNFLGNVANGDRILSENNENESTPKQSKPTNQPTGQTTKGGHSVRTAGIIGLVLVAILSLGFAGYTAMNPHINTVTQQQFLTNTQSVYSTQVQTVTSLNQVTQAVTVTNGGATSSGSGLGTNPSYYQYCSPYGCMYSPGPGYNTYNPYNPPNPWVPGYYQGAYFGYYNGNFVPPCQANSSSNNTVSCSGYIFQAQNGCTVLVIPIANAVYSESYTYQYYTLHNLPSNAPGNGSWATVTGQLLQGSNTSSSGASCPGNYINVSSVS